MPRTFNTTGSKFMTSVAQRPSAHLTLRDTGSQGETGVTGLGHAVLYQCLVLGCNGGQRSCFRRSTVFFIDILLTISKAAKLLGLQRDLY